VWVCLGRHFLAEVVSQPGVGLSGIRLTDRCDDEATGGSRRRSPGASPQLSGEADVVVDTASDHVEARSPERLVGDVEAEGGAEFLGSVHPGA
jgi:hypothetical protein